MTKATTDASHLPVPTGSTSPSNSIAPSTNPIDDHAPTPTYRDIQRAALGDLVELAKECAATENDIEVKFAATNEQITKENETALWSSNQRHKSTEEQILEKAGERSGRLAIKRKSELHKLASAANATQDKIRQEFEPQARKYRQKYDQAVWLAESVLDSTQAQLQRGGRHR